MEKMTVEKLATMNELLGQGKTRDEIAEALEITPYAATRYLNALVTVKGKGLDAVNPHVVSKDLFVALFAPKKSDTKTAPVTGYQNQLSTIKATTIMEALEERTPTMTIANLMGIEHGTVAKLQAYVKLIQAKEAEKALAYRRSGTFRDEVFDLVETRYKFKPSVIKPEEAERIQRNEMVKTMIGCRDKMTALDVKMNAIQSKLDALEINQRKLTEVLEVIMKALLAHEKDMQTVQECAKKLGDKLDAVTRGLTSVDQSVRFVGTTVMNRNLPNGKR